MNFWILINIFMTLSLMTLSAPEVDKTFEGQVVKQVNKIRVEHHLKPLQVSPELSNSAERFALDMGNKNFFNHTAPDGSTCASRNTAAGYKGWSIIAENIAAGHESPGEVVDAWMKRPGHRKNILASDITETGVGYAYVRKSHYGHYWVQEFGTKVKKKAAD